MTGSIRSRLLITLLALITGASLLAGWFAYRQALQESATLFDYQLRQMALSLRNQVSLAQQIDVPTQQEDADFVVQIWDVFGRSIVYVSRPGLPAINRPNAGYANFDFNGEPWRVYGLETVDGVIQVAQPVRIQQAIARSSAIRVALPVLLLVPILGIAIVLVVQGGLLPLQRVAAEVKQRQVNSLTPVETSSLPDEVAPLVQELNRLLARVDSALTTQRAFIADAAHELRSPLTAVRLQIQLLDRATDEAAAREARTRLGEAVDRAAHMIEQLLTLARSEPRDTVGELKPVPLETPAAEAISDMHALAQSRHIELELRAEPNVWVRGDQGALRTLVRNLVDNAVRYTPERGKVEVHVASTPNGATLKVFDSGPGIPADDRSRAFDRFYRRAVAPEGGSGLGLAIVKAIADRHNARVTLDDAPIGGLAVTVAFPTPL
jgi:two-component system OmpR family sensor kinase/two-component system sensor histidine kinase QseC